MRRVVVHYGEAPWQSSCGVRGLTPSRLSTARWAVTCWKCKGTRHWQARFWENRQVKEKED